MKLLLLILFAGVFASCSNNSFSGGQATGPAAVSEEDATKKTLNTDNIFETLAEKGIQDSDTLKLACEDAKDKLETSNQKIIYPERKDCSFGSSPNLEERNQYVQAYETNPSEIKVPEGAIICDLSLNSKDNTQLRYDDFIFLTIEGQVIFGSNDGITANLEKKEAIYQWDWNKIVGKEIEEFQAPSYCLGEAQSCILPPHDQAGPVKISLKTADIAPLAFEVAGKEKLSANLIATGDNDAEDCMHTELELDVEVKYLQL
ncbi:MAG: hypothetical protein HRU19_19255 [Pseudobacteriovorax sp.]|nr:hypothetical protein [Pseudobacteriovorax sp.]